MKILDKYIDIFKKYYEILFPALLFIIFIFVWQIVVWASLSPDESTNLNRSTILTNMVSIVGSVASVVGLIIAYLQIKEIKQKTVNMEEINIQTNREIKKALKSAREIGSAIDLSKTVSLLREAQRYLDINELKLAELRMRDLKSQLIGISNNKELSKNIVTSEFVEKETELDHNLQNLGLLISKPKRRISPQKIKNSLEGLSTILINIEKKIVNEKYE